MHTLTNIFHLHHIILSASAATFLLIKDNKVKRFILRQYVTMAYSKG